MQDPGFAVNRLCVRIRSLLHIQILHEGGVGVCAKNMESIGEDYVLLYGFQSGIRLLSLIEYQYLTYEDRSSNV
jgi:hypothetical protein